MRTTIETIAVDIAKPTNLSAPMIHAFLLRQRLTYTPVNNDDGVVNCWVLSAAACAYVCLDWCCEAGGLGRIGWLVEAMARTPEHPAPAEHP